MHRFPIRRLSPQALASIGVYALAVATALLLWVVAHAYASEGAPMRGRTLLAGAGGASTAVAGAIALVLAWRAAIDNRIAGFHAPIAANVVVLVACATVLEVAARIVARPHQLGASIGGVALVPYDWDAVRAFNLKLLERSRDPSSFYAESRELGWTIGASRRSSRGTYLSSAEGLRSGRQGEPLLPAKRTSRIAIFGDSFAFSEEVPFDQSLGVHLERRLGGDVQVLNFGVPGYGIDQAVLRFESEAARWSPQVSVLQFIADDIDRIGHVYMFNKPEWAFPFVKPRFLQRDEVLKQLALSGANETYAKATVFEIPHLDVDAGFNERKWRAFPLSWSYLARFVVSRAINQSQGKSADFAASNEQIAVALIERFVASARGIGSVPLVVFFPDHRNLDGHVSDSAGRVLAALAQRGVEALDTSKCMRVAGTVKELVVGGGPEARSSGAAPATDVADIERGAWVHYSDTGNDRMAQCILPLVKQSLARHATTETGK